MSNTLWMLGSLTLDSISLSLTWLGPARSDLGGGGAITIHTVTTAGTLFSVKNNNTQVSQI